MKFLQMITIKLSPIETNKKRLEIRDRARLFTYTQTCKRTKIERNHRTYAYYKNK